MHACACDYVHLRPLTGVRWPKSLTSSPSNGHHDLSPGGVGDQLLQTLLLVHEEAVHLQLGEVSSTPGVCAPPKGAPDGGEVRQAPLPHGQEMHLLPED